MAHDELPEKGCKASASADEGQIELLAAMLLILHM
jgi:hypothetical protein